MFGSLLEQYDFKQSGKDDTDTGCLVTGVTTPRQVPEQRRQRTTSSNKDVIFIRVEKDRACPPISGGLVETTDKIERAR